MKTLLRRKEKFFKIFFKIVMVEVFKLFYEKMWVWENVV